MTARSCPALPAPSSAESGWNSSPRHSTTPSKIRLDGRLALRLCVGQARTEERHVARAWEILRAAAAAG